jgi:hypothetical protein
MHRSPHARTGVALRIVEQYVESSRRLTQYPEEQRNLTSMVKGVIGGVMHQLSTHCYFTVSISSFRRHNGTP